MRLRVSRSIENDLLEVDPDTAPEVQKARSNIDATNEPDIVDGSLSTEKFPHLIDECTGSLSDAAVVLAAKPHKTFYFDFICVVVAVFFVAWRLPVLDQPSNVSGAIEPTRSWCATVPPTSRFQWILTPEVALLLMVKHTICFLSALMLLITLLCAIFSSHSWEISSHGIKGLVFFKREFSSREDPPLPSSARDSRHYPPWLNQHAFCLITFSVSFHDAQLDCRTTATMFCYLWTFIGECATWGSRSFTLHPRHQDGCFLFKACLLATFLVFCFEEPGARF